MKIKSVFLAAIGLVSLSFGASVAHAQMNNKPFSFKGTPDGGIGMSIGGQQAIVNQKILGVTPNTLVRAPDGVLLNVTEGPGKSAIVSFQNGGGVIPTFKGSSFRGNNNLMAVGVFNNYFVPDGGSNRSSVVYTRTASSSASVSTWTARVATGMPASYSPVSVVDSWTGLVFIP